MRVAILFLVLILSSSASLWACEFEERLETIATRVKTEKQTLTSKSFDNADDVKQQLALMVERDIEVRGLFIEDMNNPKTRKLLEEVDRLHTDHLKAILDKYGWPTISKFGKEADHHAWLLVQHADHDPDFQIRCLLILEKLWPLDQTDRKNYAYLYDRMAPYRELKQHYGTQAKIEGNQIELLPFEGSLEDLNQRRHEVGLGSIEEYLETLKKVYKK